MLTRGPIHHEVGANVEATSFGGIAAVHRLVTKLGLPEAIHADLGWRRCTCRTASPTTS